MNIALVDYGAGNIHSAAKALEIAGKQRGIDVHVTATCDSGAILAADRIVLPGDGAFAHCMTALRNSPGVVEALGQAVLAKNVPFLGICVGMQLLATESEEHGSHSGLNLLAGKIKRLQPGHFALKVPHMGWNELLKRREHSLLTGLDLGPSGQTAYFLHSYHFEPANQDDIIASADYGGPVTALVARGNIAGCQFHPEKSQALGLTLLGNFLSWQP